MNKIKKTFIFIIALLVFFSACYSQAPYTSSNEEIMKKYFQDVYKITDAKSMQVTSYGGFCDFPMQNGRYLRIKFYGNDLIVGAIEEITSPS